MHKLLSLIILSICISLSNISIDTAFAKDGDENKKPLYWIDPMEPDVHYDKPGKSSMGMELVPVYEEPTKKEPSSPKKKTKKENKSYY